MRADTSKRSSPAVTRSKRNEIVIAIIGLVGVITTGFFSNYEKMFPPHNVVTATYSGYTPTRDPQVEARYFIELSARREQPRQNLEAVLPMLQKTFADNLGLNAQQQNVMANAIRDQFENMTKEVIEAQATLTAKYFSASELQELNKFYSTPKMRELVRKQPLLAREENLNWGRVLQSDITAGLARLASFRQGLRGKERLSGASLREAVRSLYQLAGC